MFGAVLTAAWWDGHQNPYYSVVVKGEKQQFSWNEADVLNWSTEKPYDF